MTVEFVDICCTEQPFPRVCLYRLR